MRNGFTRSGALIAAEQQERKDALRAAERSGRERFDALVGRALEVGFTEREAPFAAMARLVRGPATVATIRAHLRATRPALYDTDLQT
jgi:hypothetical protein